VLDRVCPELGCPGSIRVEQGSEFISRELDPCAYMKGVTLDFSDDAVRKCEAWRGDCNEVRPHSAIGNKPPISLVNRSAANDPPLSA
jgi:putative transposase